MLIYIAVTGYLVGIVTFFAFMWGTSGRHDVDQGHGFPVLNCHGHVRQEPGHQADRR